MRTCPACENGSADSVGAKNGFDVERCTRCATVFTATVPSTEEEGEDYSSYYDSENLRVPSFVEQRLDELVASFEPYRDRNRWLDVGCGAGALVQAAAERGWKPTGTEVAVGAAESVRSQGFDVRVGELQALDLEPGSFDVVSAVEVLEHVPDPGTLVEAAAQLLRPGGALYITTPHGRGISARLLRTDWSVISPPEHLQLFSVKGLRDLLTVAGLQVTRLQAHTVNPHELIAGLRRKSDVRPPVDRVATAYRLNESLSSRRSGRAAKAAINGGLNMLRLGDSLKVTARRPGGQVALP